MLSSRMMTESLHLLLVDYENFLQNDIVPLNAIKSFFDSVYLENPPQRINLVVRAYGGWFDDQSTSEARYKAAESLGIWPTFFEYAKTSLGALRFEFADELLGASDREGNRIGINSTVATRNSIPPIRLTENARNCPAVGCEAPRVARWLGKKKKRGCPRVGGCPNEFADMFVRKEQKQVDIHLAMDLLTCISTSQYVAVGVVSDDWDFLPAIAKATAMIEKGVRLCVLRCTQEKTYLDLTLERLGANIILLKR